MAKNIISFGGGDIAEAIGGTIYTKYQCDVRNFYNVYEIIEQEKPDVVVVTAGVSHPATIKESLLENWTEEIQVNLIGSYNVAKACTLLNVKTMIFIASVAGLHGKPNHSGYSASKSGVISLVQSLAEEGYDAYAISPGRVDTSMREQDYPKEDKRTRLKTSEIADLVQDIIKGKYEPGDNLIIRRIGYKTVPIKIDKGKFKKWLGIGLPKKY